MRLSRPLYARLRILPQARSSARPRLRRSAQLLNRRPDLQVVEFRGNVQTRLKKLDEGVAECTFLAMAGSEPAAHGGRARDRRSKPQTCCPPWRRAPSGSNGGWTTCERRRTAGRDPRHAEPASGWRRNGRFLRTLDGSCETPIAGSGGAGRRRSPPARRGAAPRRIGGDRGVRKGPISDGAALGKDLAQELLKKAGHGFFDWHATGT